MTGFWDYTSIPTGQSFKMNRDQFVKEMLRHCPMHRKPSPHGTCVKDLLLHAEELLQVSMQTAGVQLEPTAKKPLLQGESCAPGTFCASLPLESTTGTGSCEFDFEFR